MEESIIIYCQHRLGLDRWSDLRSLDVMPRFLDLILSEELTRVFPPIQYQYAANLINGGRKSLKNNESVMIYLHEYRDALAKFESSSLRLKISSREKTARDGGR